ncbi:MAG: hypothetical protein J2P40_01105 [Candidatus Dormibacteraeota bacterium]|nr:hypothetical protein [Candidatus Dormibacteraeota bacterium]MBO0759846.1 hypothetical protein [Candidatus Dormibacteraeota bacterium]
MASAPRARAAAGPRVAAGAGVAETTDSREFTTCSEDMIRNAVAGTKARARRRGPRAALALTDRLLGQLEELNLDGRGNQRLPARIRGELAEIGPALSANAHARLEASRTVQECLDAIFDVQEELLGACAWAARVEAGWEMPPLARAS